MMATNGGGLLYVDLLLLLVAAFGIFISLFSRLQLQHVQVLMPEQIQSPAHTHYATG